jgi:hypothetical protein
LGFASTNEGLWGEDGGWLDEGGGEEDGDEGGLSWSGEVLMGESEGAWLRVGLLVGLPLGLLCCTFGGVLGPRIGLPWVGRVGL